MKKSVLVFVVLILAGINNLGLAKQKTRSVPPAPLPKQILTSQTVFLAKGPGNDPYLKGGAELAYDTFYTSIKDWGKYRIVDSPDQADLVMELSYSSQAIGTHVWSSTNYDGSMNISSSPEMDPRVSLNIYDRKTGFVLWSAAEARDTARFRRNRAKNLVNAVHEMVDNLKFRIQSSRSEQAAP